MDRASDNDAALLDRYRPWLVYDSQTACFAMAAEFATDSPGSTLRRGRRVIASSDGVPRLSLSMLGQRPPDGDRRTSLEAADGAAPEPLVWTEGTSQEDAYTGRDSDRLRLAKNRLELAREMSARPGYSNRIYGRVFTTPTRTYVQFWLWFPAIVDYDLMRDARFLGSAARRETAWRLIQVELDAETREPTRVLLPNAGYQKVAWEDIERQDDDRPRLYVAPLTHGIYAAAGIAWRASRCDGSDGRGKQVLPELVRLDEAAGWHLWPGRWGDTEVDPTSPGRWHAWKHPQWVGWFSPYGWLMRDIGRVVRQWSRRHGPVAPAGLVARLEHGRVVVSYEFTRRLPSQRLLITVHEPSDEASQAADLLGVGTLRRLERSGEEHIVVPAGVESCDVHVSVLRRGRREHIVIPKVALHAPDRLERSILRSVVANQLGSTDIAEFMTRFGVSDRDLNDAIERQGTKLWEPVAEDLQAFRDARAAYLARRRAGATLRDAAWRASLLLTAPVGLLLVVLGVALEADWLGWLGSGILYLGLALTVVAWRSIRRLLAASATLRSVPEADDYGGDAPLVRARRVFERALAEKSVAPLMREHINARTTDRYTDPLHFSARGVSELRVPEAEVRTRATSDLLRLTGEMRGGSIGIAGPRGVGKSTLIRSYCRARTTDDRRLTTELNAPVRYDPRDFLLTLFGQLCDAALAGDPGGRPVLRLTVARTVALLLVPAGVLAAAAVGSEGPGSRIPAATLAAILGAVAAGVLLDVRWRPYLGAIVRIAAGVPLIMLGLEKPDDAWHLLAIASGLLLAVLGLFRAVAVARTGPTATEAATAEDRLRDLAAASREEIRFQQSWSHGYSGKFAVPLGGEVSADKQRTLERRQATFPELVDRLRAFLAVAVEARGQVAIGIDEMDKMESGDAAEQFLNEIKAVFGVEGCFYLISISESAMSSFERRGLPFRDVFDSSFDEVLTLTPLSLADSKRLLRSRVLGLGPPFLDLAHCVSGGLARDLLRVARRLSLYDEDDRSVAAVTRWLVKDELERKVEAASVSAMGVGLEPYGGAVQFWMRTLKLERTMTAVELARAAAASPAGWPPLRPDDDERAKQLDALEALRLELASFTYYLARVLHFFTAAPANPEEHFRAAERGEDRGESELDGLARARAAFGVNPRVAVFLVDSFRAGVDGWSQHDLDGSPATAGAPATNPPP